MVDAGCVRDEGSFTLHIMVDWLRFIWLGLESGSVLGYIYVEKYVSLFLEKAVRYSLSRWLCWK